MISKRPVKKKVARTSGTRKRTQGKKVGEKKNVVKNETQGTANSPGGNKRTNLGDPVLKIPVVGVGASAGGLEAFRQLFQSMPGNTGIAFILVQHLDPTHESLAQR